MLSGAQVYQGHGGVAAGVQVPAGRRGGRDEKSPIEERSVGVEDGRRAGHGVHFGGGCYMRAADFGSARTLLVVVRIVMGRSLVKAPPPPATEKPFSIKL